MRIKNAEWGSRRSPGGGFTVVELLAVVACAALAGLVLLACVRPRRMPDNSRARCQNNLKQLGLAFRSWSADNGDKYPMSIPDQIGGAMESCRNGRSYRAFQVMSNELSANFRLLVCPRDTRNAATNFSALANTNVSYFAGVEADETLPGLWLDGDRNVTTNGTELAAGLVTIADADKLGWSKALHASVGNVGLADGSVQRIDQAKVLEKLRQDAPGKKVMQLAVP